MNPLLSTACFLSLSALAQPLPPPSADSVQLSLPEVEVGATEKPTVRVLGRSRIHWDMAALARLPQVMGNSDPVRSVRLLPGVQTNNEYDTGLHIYGCEYSHNVLSVDGVPVYNASHLLGLFSTFTPSHYGVVTVNKTCSEAAFPNRLGGQVDLSSLHTLCDSVAGEAAVGLLSSQGTVRVPTGRHATLTVSGRMSYVNLLYGYALHTDDNQLRYRFADVNVTWLWHPTARDHVWLDGYWGGDHASMDEERYRSQLRLRWGNTLVAAHWQRKLDSDRQMRHTAYFTRFANRLTVDYPGLALVLPSGITEWGYRSLWQGRHACAGVDAAWRRIKPQVPQATGIVTLHNPGNSTATLTQEYSPHVGVTVPVGDHAVLLAGLRGALYVDATRQCHWSLNPSLSLSVTQRTWLLTLTAAMRHQCYFQTGFSSMGFPTEYWTPAGGALPPQRAASLSATVGRPLPWWGLRVDVEAYYKRLSHIAEYDGTLLDIVTTDTGSGLHLLTGRGRNYGAGITVSRPSGRLSGWISYNVGRARRHFDSASLPDTYSASHERIHELNAVAMWTATARWSLSGTVTFATGTPFTAVEHLYLYAGHVLTQHGARNSSRLAHYCRVDLSVTYKLRQNGKSEQGLNFSVYNALNNRNELFQAWKITDSGELSYHPVSFLVRVMPSLSYYVKF
ncbi:MAG: TonB-dependent receptor [Muribaculaceae bacterium]|nr:TonB-dependent receptor [Muribaculaceae bacterium]